MDSYSVLLSLLAVLVIACLVSAIYDIRSHLSMPVSVYRTLWPKLYEELEAEVIAERELEHRRKRLEHDWNWLVTTDIGVEMDDVCPRCEGEGKYEDPYFSGYRFNPPMEPLILHCDKCDGLGWVLDKMPCKTFELQPKYASAEWVAMRDANGSAIYFGP